MGRRLFLQHLRETTASPPSSISNVHSPDEGVVAFTFSYVQQKSPHVCSIRLLALNIDEYPDGNPYMLFTEDEHIDPTIASSFELISPRLIGIPLAEALSNISIALHDFVSKGVAGNPIDLDSEENEDGDDFDDGFLDGQDEDGDDFDNGFLDGQDSDIEEFGLIDAFSEPAKGQRQAGGSSTVTLDKIKSDLRAVKKAGFRVGVIGNLATGGIVTVSIRVTKLGLSDEAMRAWGLQNEQYLVLLIRFGQGYRSLEQVASESKLGGRVQIQVALCKSYKPSGQDGYAAFENDTKKGHVSNSATPLEPVFIGTPLNDLFRERFASVVRFRQACGLNWRSAEAMVHDLQGKQEELDSNAYALPDDVADRALPPMMMDDALQAKSAKDASLPLVAMQFLLRHFVRCTEFCLVCHCQVEATFEALKPYVCSKPLCLYQYMSLGFGPSIEWEVLSEPYVVDLLVSFCYAAAKQGRLKEFPVGIDLKVPVLPHFKDKLLASGYRNQTNNQNIKETVGITDIRPSFKAHLDFDNNKITFDASRSEEMARFRVGDWLVARLADLNYDYHYQIDEIYFPIWQLGKPFMCKGTMPVDCYVYESNFDELSREEKCHAVATILDALPSVADMKTYLQGSGTTKETQLKSWKTRISPTGLNVLRWIIASNRSCIVQVDPLLRRDQAKASDSSGVASGLRVSGMDEWVQFRFAQGAPDKEQRFVDCVQRETRGAKYPTLFAWHGSALSNWHSIIRHGLRFEEVLNGRAYGNGVYMSNQATTSVGYTGMGRGAIPQRDSLKWPQSVLGVTSAVSLQEVVNRTGAFVSASPHYVVANTDWIQTRYLFIKSDLRHSPASTALVATFEQDPQHQCFNESKKPIQIPFLDPPKDASVSATNALQRALKEAVKVQKTARLSRLGWYIHAGHISNLYQWIVELHSFDEKLPLAQDMKKAGIQSITLEMRFTNEFPFAPPFIRVVQPRFLPFSAGGGGHVTEGGAICMELLTNTGWTAVTSIEMVLLQVRLAISDEERPARLSANAKARHRPGYGGDSYGVGEAVAAYERACRAHGWKIPDGFSKFGQEEAE
ncbi:hypothetical protein DV735_g1893, partial [Chaetothyriales sp. CBS 134920]